MRTFDQWMDEYGVSHQNKKNQLIHKICVPLIMFSVIGFFWSLPVIEELPNWGILFTCACLAFYLTLNFLMFLGMLLLSIFTWGICSWLQNRGILVQVSVIIFVLAWIGQFYGHKIEGKKPSFLQDLVFLLIGPLWVLRFFFQRISHDSESL